jgi:hypothetical protein
MKNLFTIFAILITTFTSGQNCYTNITNLTGFELDFGQPILESHACNLKNKVDEIFNFQSGQFKVFSAHLYFHISSLSESSKAEQVNLVINQCEQASQFYLAIITHPDSYGLFNNFKIMLKLPTQAQIPCLNQSKIAQIEDKVRQYIVRKYDRSIYSLPNALAIGMDFLSDNLSDLNQNNCCILSDYEILSMFKQNSFRGIPINLESPSIANPLARFSSNNLHDFANTTFTLDGREINFGSMDFQGISTEILVTKNQNLCDNNGADYQEALNLFSSSSNVCWYHIWISPDEENSDFLLVKTKPFGGSAETVPTSVAYLKRLEKEVVKYKPMGETDDTPPIEIVFTFPVYGFTLAAISLLGNLADTIPLNPLKEIEDVEIRNNGGGVLPAYDVNGGGGGMTFPWFKNRHQAVIQYTANFFATTGFNFNKGNDVYSWLSISAHEVGHIKHIRDCDCETWVYFGSFVWEYAVNFGHDTAPREIEADIARLKFFQFDDWLISIKRTSITKIFNNSMGDWERQLHINGLWAEYLYR